MKPVATKNVGDQYTAIEFNKLTSEELQNAVVSSSQSLSESDQFQMSKTIAQYSSDGDFYIDAGSANNYILSPQTPRKGISNYFNGQKIRFVALNTNTSSSTVNISSIGIKQILNMNGGALIGGEIQTGQIINLFYDGSAFKIVNYYHQSHLRRFVEGLTMSNNTIDANYDIDASIGSCSDSTNSIVMISNSVFTKQLDAVWAQGTNAGGRASAVSLTSDTYYHFFIIMKLDGTVDFGFDTSVTAANLLADASGFVYYRRLNSVRTDGSSHILPFYAQNDYIFYNTTPGILITNTIPGASLTDLNINTPSGIIVLAKLRAIFYSTAGMTTGSMIEYYQKTGGCLTASSWVDYDGGLSVTSSSDVTFDIFQNTSSLIQYRSSLIGGGAAYSLYLIGWQELNY